MYGASLHGPPDLFSSMQRRASFHKPLVVHNRAAASPKKNTQIQRRIFKYPQYQIPSQTGTPSVCCDSSFSQGNPSLGQTLVSSFRRCAYATINLSLLLTQIRTIQGIRATILPCRNNLTHVSFFTQPTFDRLDSLNICRVMHDTSPIPLTIVAVVNYWYFLYTIRVSDLHVTVHTYKLN